MTKNTSTSDFSHGWAQIPKRMRISKIFELIQSDNARQGFTFSQLRPFQLEGILDLFNNRSVFVVNKTGSGKTTIAKPCLAMALVKGKVGVYLVPHTRLLDEKTEDFQCFFQNTAHIIKLSGEFKPTQEELCRYKNKIIIIATYEAFRAFLFQVQNRKYFKSRKPFGAVVVDEIHMLADRERGWKLETMLYKLKDEFGPLLFCGLSATFKKDAARLWSTLLGCKLIYRMPQRIFTYEEVIKQHTKKSGEDHKKAQEEKIFLVLDKVDEFVKTYIEKKGDNGKSAMFLVKDAKLLIFCDSREFSEKLADKINERVYYSFKDFHKQIYCSHIHAGVPRAKQPAIYKRFNEGSGIRILTSTTLLQTGIDVNNIKTIIVTDAEKHSAVTLAQMCGRSREDKPNIIFFVADESPPDTSQQWEDLKAAEQEKASSVGIKKLEEFGTEPFPVPGVDYYTREWFYETKLIMNQDFAEFKDVPNNDLEIHGFQLNLIPPGVQPQHMPRLVLEALFRRQITKKKLMRFLKRYDEIKYTAEEEQEYSLHRILHAFITKDLICEKKGYYSLTPKGTVIVETGISLPMAYRSTSFFQRWENLFDYQKLFSMLSNLFRSLGNPFYQKETFQITEKTFHNYYSKFLTREIAQEVNIQVPKVRIQGFLSKYHAKKFVQKKELLNQYGIASGDEELIRRTGVWLASSLYSLFTLSQIDDKDRSPPSSLQVPCNKVQLVAKTEQTLSEMIHRYQSYSERGRKKPEIRPHPVYTARSKYHESILKFLRARKWRGATISEIQRHLKPSFNNWGLSGSYSSIWSALNRTLKGYLYKRKEYTGTGRRPPDRYWLYRYKPPPLGEHTCQECVFLVKNPEKRLSEYSGLMYCNQIGRGRSRYQAACDDFKHQQKSRYFRSDLDVIARNQKKIVRCPHCGTFSVLLPTQQRITICKKCELLLWRTHQKRYVGQRYVKILRKEFDDEGFPFIQVYRHPQNIFMKEGWTLEVSKTEQSKLPIVKTYFHGRYQTTYFFDEIGNITLAGGKIRDGISETDLEALRSHGIQFDPYTSKQIEAMKAAEEENRELREALETVDGMKRVEKAQELVLAKMQSNIYYSFQLQEILPLDRLPPETITDLVLRQFDHMLWTFFTIKELKDTHAFLSTLFRRNVLFGIPFNRFRGSTIETACEESNLANIQELVRDLVDPTTQYINRLRAQEGNAEKPIWKAVKHGLPPLYFFTGRKSYRWVKTAMYWGAKALDPFNAALNFLYFCLQLMVAEALASAGFSQFWPGRGIVHRRYKKPLKTDKSKGEESDRWVESKKNKEILFDIMDSYRPPFRHYLLLDFLEIEKKHNTTSKKHLTKKDFNMGLDEWHRHVYYPNKQGRAKLEQLFKEICEKKFWYKRKDETEYQQISLSQILHLETQDFANFVRGTSNRHTPFIAFEDRRQMQWVRGYYKLLLHLAEYKAPLDPFRPKYLTSSENLLPTRVTDFDVIQAKNVIIVTHNDLDGFNSALLLMIKYYEYLPNLHIIIADNYPFHQSYIRRILKNKIPKLLVEDAQNIVIVADFPIQWQLKVYQDIKRIFLEEVGGFDNLLSIHWYDHHVNPQVPPSRLGMVLRMNVHWDTSRHTFQYIWAQLCKQFDALKQDILINLQFLGIAALLKLVRKHTTSKCPKEVERMLDKSYLAFTSYSEFLNNPQQKRFYNTFRALTLTKEGSLTQKQDSQYLKKWYDWFRAYQVKESRRPKNWTQLFREICTKIYTEDPKEAPAIPKELQEEISPEPSLMYARIFVNVANQTIGFFIFTKPYPINEVKQLIRKYSGGKDIDVAVCYWSEHYLSVRAYNLQRAQVSGLLIDQGIRAHEATGPIYTPVKRIMDLDLKASKRNLYLYQYRPPDEMLTYIQQSNLTQNPKTMLHEELLKIPKHSKLVRDLLKQFEIEEDKEKQKQILKAIVESTTVGFSYFQDEESSDSEKNLDSTVFDANIPIHFPCKKEIMLPQGKITLFYADWGHYFKLSYFLHYFLHAYLSSTRIPIQQSKPRILFVDTTERTLQFKLLINFFTPRTDLKAILYTQIDDLPTLLEFIEQKLGDIILDNEISLVIFSSLFELFEEHVSSETVSPYLFRDRLRAQERDFLRALNLLLQDVKVSILFTRVGILHDEWNDTIQPFLPRQVRDMIKNKLFFHPTRKRFHLIPIGFKDVRKAVRMNSNYIECPSEVPSFFFPFLKLVNLPFDQLVKDKDLINFTIPEVDPWTQLEDKLMEHPQIQETIYEMKFLVCCFKKNAGDYRDLNNLVSECLANDPHERALDLILWPAQNYSIFNCTIDLSVLYENFGGYYIKRGSQSGKGMFFSLENVRVRPFREFRDALLKIPLDFQQLTRHLETITEDIMSYGMQEESNAEKEEITEMDITGIWNGLSSIFIQFPPPWPWMVTETWENFIRELHLYFTWGEIALITKRIFSELITLRSSRDVNAIETIFQTSLLKFKSE